MGHTSGFQAAGREVMPTIDDHKSNKPFRWRELLIQACILVALLAAAFPGAFFKGELLSAADILYGIEPWSEYAPPGFERPHNALMVDVVCAFRPWYSVGRMALDHGEWPLWNPMQYMGVPLLANCQSAVLYPPRLLHAFLDLDTATSLFFLFKLFLCGMTAYICGRGLGMGIWASRFLSVAWAIGAYNFVWTYWPLPDVSAWMPIVFLGAETILMGKYRRGFFTLALGGALLLLAGHPETAFTMALGVGIYFVLRLIMDRQWGRGLALRLAAAAGAWALALCVTAPQLLPFLEYLLHSSTLFERHEAAHAPPLDEIGVATFFVPKFFGTTSENTYWGNRDTNRHFMVYPAIVTWICLALIAGGPLRDRLLRRRFIAAVIPGVFGLLLAFGVEPFGKLNHYPPFNALIPSYNICFLVFAMPLFAAWTIDRRFDARHHWRSLIAPAAVVLVGLAVVGLVFATNSGYIRLSGMTAYMNAQFVKAALITIATAVVLVLACVKRLGVAGKMAVTVLLAVDLLLAGQHLNPTLPRSMVYPDTELITHLQGLPQPTRTGFTEAGIPSGMATTFLIEEPLGYDGLYPARIVRYMNTLGREVWNAMEPVYGSEQYLRIPRMDAIFPTDHASDWEKTVTLDGVEVWKNTDAFPRAFLVPQVEVEPDLETMFERMKDPDFDPAQIVLAEAPLSVAFEGLDTTLDGSAEVTRRTTAHVEIQYRSNQPAALVLSDAYYPGWQAYIDGEPAPMFPAYHAFRGLIVPAGEHLVEYRYEPWTFRVGLAMSVAAMLGVWVYALRMLFGRRFS
jgi:hypothetical protein